MSQTKLVEKIKSTFVFNNHFSTNHAIYEIKLKNIVEPGRPQMTRWRMRIACWITKATDTLRICNTYCFSTITMVARTRLITLHYLACLVAANPCCSKVAIIQFLVM